MSDAILFVSSSSKACKPCMDFIAQTGFPVKIVRLDTTKARRQASQGSPHFQVVSVPTMIVTYDDGNLQMFVGGRKITDWIGTVIQSAKMSAQASFDMTGADVANSTDPTGFAGGADGIQKPRTSKSKIQFSYPGQKRNIAGPPPPQPPPLNDESSGPVEFLDPNAPPEEEIEYMVPSDVSDDSHTEIQEPPPRREYRPQPETGSVKDVAARMERERQATLKYREEDLPKSTY
jgi:hypothetical protein